MTSAKVSIGEGGNILEGDKHCLLQSDFGEFVTSSQRVRLGSVIESLDSVQNSRTNYR